MARVEASAQVHNLQQFSGMPEMRGAEMRGQESSRGHRLVRAGADGGRFAACEGVRRKGLTGLFQGLTARELLTSNGIRSSARLACFSIFIEMPH